MFLSSLIGTTQAIVLPLLNISSLLQVPIKLALGVVMVLVLSSYLRLKEFVFSFLLFLFYTLVLVGACLVTLLTFGTSLEALAAGGYDMAVPLGIILAIVALYISIIVYIAKYLNRKRDLSPFLRKIKLILKDKELAFDAFIDSGNKLIDASTGLPVVILSLNALKKHFSTDELESLMLMQGKDTSFKNVHTCSYGTLSGDAKKMVVFEADKLVINDGHNEYTTNRFVVGVTYKQFKDVANYDCLLNVGVVEGG